MLKKWRPQTILCTKILKELERLKLFSVWCYYYCNLYPVSSFWVSGKCLILHTIKYEFDKFEDLIALHLLSIKTNFSKILSHVKLIYFYTKFICNNITIISGETYYANRSEMIGAWHKVRLSEIIPSGTKRDGQTYSQTMYLVSIENRQKNVQWKVISGKEIAYAESCPVQLEVGARIIAVFKDSVVVGETKKLKKDSFYPGIIAEPLLHSNKYR